MRRKSILWVIEKFADGGAGGVLSLDHGGRPKCLDFGEIRGVGKEERKVKPHGLSALGQLRVASPFNKYETT